MHSNITSSCRGRRGRRRSGRDRPNIWPAGRESGTKAKATPLEITTTTRVTAASHALGVEAEVAAGLKSPKGPALF